MQRSEAALLTHTLSLSSFFRNDWERLIGDCSASPLCMSNEQIADWSLSSFDGNMTLAYWDFSSSASAVMSDGRIKRN
ncbi:MAG: hypothetical protein HYZ69_00655 [Candidatus Colwellbacteria bacterium]|nr:hypothetical protein [Candidatus Colwellbacteria bacterium]